MLSLNRVLPHVTLRKSTGSISTKIIGQQLGEVLATRRIYPASHVTAC